MRAWDFETRRVEDVDRQLLANDAEMVDATPLPQRARERYPLGLFQRSPLSREPMMFVKSEVATLASLAVAS